MTIVSPYRAEQVGSFLRPKYLLDARARFKDGTLDAAGLRVVEDQAIAAVVKFQEGLGLRVVGDGEFRRTFFHVDFLVQLEGVTEKGGLSIKFHRAEGDIDYAPPVLEISGKVRHRRPIQRADFEYLKSVTHVVPKVTIPSPTMLHFRTGREDIIQQDCLSRHRRVLCRCRDCVPAGDRGSRRCRTAVSATG